MHSYTYVELDAYVQCSFYKMMRRSHNLVKIKLLTRFAFCSAARLPSSRSSYILYNMEYRNIRNYVASYRYLALL